MHKKFEIIYEEYKLMHARSLQLEQAGIKQKYVYAKTIEDGGLGNRFPQLITAMILGIILNRTLLVTWHQETNLTDLIDPGFQIGKPEWLDLSSRSVKEHYSGVYDFRVLMENNLTEYFQDYDVAYLVTSDYPLILLYGNPYYKEWMLENFGMNPFSIIGAKLLKPTSVVQKIVDEFKTKKFGKYNIGLQIRTEKIRYYNTLEKVIPLYFSLGKILQRQYFPFDANNTKFFIASDSEEIINNTKKSLGYEYVTAVEPFRPRYSNDSELYAWVDMLLLASCDTLIISYRSSFGYVAGALEATDTYMLFADNTYGQLSMSEPCYYNMHNSLKLLEPDHLNHLNPVYLAQLRCHD